MCSMCHIRLSLSLCLVCVTRYSMRFFWFVVILSCCGDVLSWWCAVVAVYCSDCGLLWWCIVVIMYVLSWWCIVVIMHCCGDVYCGDVLLWLCIVVVMFYCGDVVVVVYCCDCELLCWCVVVIMYCCDYVLLWCPHFPLHQIFRLTEFRLLNFRW